MSEHQFDIGIIGCGPAGLSAAVNAKNNNRDIVVLGAEICSPPLHKAVNKQLSGVLHYR